MQTTWIPGCGGSSLLPPRQLAPCEAEKFFGKKREDIICQYFIKLFIPEPEKKKTEKNLNEIFSRLPGGKFKMKVIAAGGNVQDIECSANVLVNYFKITTGMIIIIKK